MRILVTGGAGFIGGHLVVALGKRGDDIYTIDLRARDHVDRVDIKDPKEVFCYLDKTKPECVIHLAANCSVAKSVRDPAYDAQTNIQGTVNVLQAAAHHGAKQFIFASSGGTVYGNVSSGAADELYPTNPQSPYGLSKLAAEGYVRWYAENMWLPATILRLANVYGPRQDPNGESAVVATFMRTKQQGQPVQFYGGGLCERDYVYVDDVVDAFVRAVDTHGEASHGADVFNIGTGIATSTRRLAELIGVDGTDAPWRAGDVARNVLDCARAKWALGWQPQVGLADGLDRTWAADFGNS